MQEKPSHGLLLKLKPVIDYFQLLKSPGNNDNISERVSP